MVKTRLDKKIIRPLFFIVLVFCWLTLTAGVFDKTELILDTNMNIVYQYITADKLIVSFESDAKTSKNLYNKGYFAVNGIISEIKKNNKEFELRTINEQIDRVIICNTKNQELVASFNKGDKIIVYGQLEVGMSGKLSIDIDNAVLSNAVIPASAFATKDGHWIDSESTFMRYLNNNTIRFEIPESWSKVQHDIISEDLGEIEGYQFCLNEIVGSQAVEPESFFVCYFDNKMLSSPGDKSKTDAIERSILCNILKKEEKDLNKFPIKLKTYYGLNYQYYQGETPPDFLGNKYHAEFAFQQNGNDGIIIYLYVYKDSTAHLNDVFYAMRSLSSE